MGRERVLIVGYSTRALAESVVAAGWECSSIDAFGDLDQKAHVRSVAMQRDLGRPYSAAAAVAAAGRIAAPCAAYTGNLENHAAAVQRLALGRELLGNSPATLYRSRDFGELRRVVRRAGGRLPRTYLPGDPRPRLVGTDFLAKPVRGGGGQGIRELRDVARLPDRDLIQERIDGTPGSVSFVADGRSALVLGVARGLAGEAAFGATGFRYCGSLFPLTVGARALERLEAIVQSATQAFGLVGLNGIDFVLCGDQPFVVELNPRYSASMELIQRAGVKDLFALHTAACRGSLPSSLPRLGSGVWGKAVVWARRNVVAPETRSWLERDDIRDIPFPGEQIRGGTPVCTVFGHGRDADACRAALVETARAVERALLPVREPVRPCAAVR